MNVKDILRAILSISVVHAYIVHFIITWPVDSVAALGNVIVRFKLIYLPYKLKDIGLTWTAGLSVLDGMNTINIIHVTVKHPFPVQSSLDVCRTEQALLDRWEEESFGELSIKVGIMS